MPTIPEKPERWGGLSSQQKKKEGEKEVVILTPTFEGRRGRGMTEGERSSLLTR